VHGGRRDAYRADRVYPVLHGNRPGRGSAVQLYLRRALHVPSDSVYPTGAGVQRTVYLLLSTYGQRIYRGLHRGGIGLLDSYRRLRNAVSS